jgi:hypothetical protein
MTVIGVIIYLIIDITILPNRTDVTVRKHLLNCIDDLIASFKNSVDAIQSLLIVFKQRSLAKSSKLKSLSGKEGDNRLVSKEKTHSIVQTSSDGVTLEKLKADIEIFRATSQADEDNHILHFSAAPPLSSTRPSSPLPLEVSATIMSVESEEKESVSTEEERKISLTLTMSNINYCDKCLAAAELKLKSVNKLVKSMESTLQLVR